MTPLEPFDVFTPLGAAWCIGVYDNTDDPRWCCWMYNTQEMWWFDNKHVRRKPSVSNTLMSISPFSHINTLLRRQIERYVANGWLPVGYDPSKVETWRY